MELPESHHSWAPSIGWSLMALKKGILFKSVGNLFIKKGKKVLTVHPLPPAESSNLVYYFCKLAL